MDMVTMHLVLDILALRHVYVLDYGTLVVDASVEAAHAS